MSYLLSSRASSSSATEAAESRACTARLRSRTSAARANLYASLSGSSRASSRGALQSGQRRDRHRQVVGEAIAARVGQRYQDPRESHESPVDRLASRRWRGRVDRNDHGADALQPLAERARRLHRRGEIEACARRGLQRLQLAEQRLGGARVVER